MVVLPWMLVNKRFYLAFQSVPFRNAFAPIHIIVDGQSNLPHDKVARIYMIPSRLCHALLSSPTAQRHAHHIAGVQITCDIRPDPDDPDIAALTREQLGKILSLLAPMHLVFDGRGEALPTRSTDDIWQLVEATISARRIQAIEYKVSRLPSRRAPLGSVCGASNTLIDLALPCDIIPGTYDVPLFPSLLLLRDLDLGNGSDLGLAIAKRAPALRDIWIEMTAPKAGRQAALDALAKLQQDTGAHLQGLYMKDRRAGEYEPSPFDYRGFTALHTFVLEGSLVTLDASLLPSGLQRLRFEQAYRDCPTAVPGKLLALMQNPAWQEALHALVIRAGDTSISEEQVAGLKKLCEQRHMKQVDIERHTQPSMFDYDYAWSYDDDEYPSEYGDDDEETMIRNSNYRIEREELALGSGDWA